MNSSTVIFPVSRNVDGPVGAGVMYSRILVKAEVSLFMVIAFQGSVFGAFVACGCGCSGDDARRC
jgi:hypothetical protein